LGRVDHFVVERTDISIVDPHGKLAKLGSGSKPDVQQSFR
jgi:hypothetical protein